MSNPNRPYACDGHLVDVTPDGLRKGNVLRTVEADSGVPAFSDQVIVDIFYQTASGTRLRDDEVYKYLKGVQMVKLARPYAYVSGADTCCPVVLTGVEHYEVEMNKLCAEGSRFKLVVNSTGEAAHFGLKASI